MGAGRRAGARTEELKKTQEARDNMLSLAYGACCHANCVLRARAIEEMDAGKPLPAAESSFVVVTCTNKACTAGGQMHTECYARKLKECVHTLRRKHVSEYQRVTISEEEMEKAVWNQKYNLVKPHCQCACGAGFFCAENEGKRGVVKRRNADGSSVVVAGDATSRKSKLETALAEKAKRAQEAKQEERERRARQREEATQRNLQKAQDKVPPRPAPAP